MFRDVGSDALIERAYDAQRDRIAHVEKGEREPAVMSLEVAPTKEE